MWTAAPRLSPASGRSLSPDRLHAPEHAHAVQRGAARRRKEVRAAMKKTQYLVCLILSAIGFIGAATVCMLNACLLGLSLVNFAVVSYSRMDTPRPDAAERAAVFRVSKQATLRVFAGFWLVLYGVPMSGFYVLMRECEDA